MNRFSHIVIAVLVAGFFAVAVQGCGGGVTGAKLYIQQKNYPAAAQALEQEIAQNPNNDEAHYLLGKVYYDQKEFLKSKVNLKKSLELNPASPYKAEIDGMIFTMWGMAYNDGAAYYNRLVKAKDERTRLAYADSAARKFEQGITLREDTATTYNLLASVYSVQKKQAQAIGALERAVQIGAADAQSYENLANLYLTATPSQTDNAITALEKAMAAKISSPGILRALGLAYMQKKQYDKAEPLMAKAVSEDPNNKALWFYYGLLLGDKKTTEADMAAITKYERALKIDSTFSEAAFNLAIAYVRLAEADAEKNKSLGTEKAPYKGHYQYYEKAIKYLRPAATRDNKKDQWRLLAKLYARIDNGDLAKDALKKEETAME
ncbi:MAG: tetratricopeptide repeat protein [Chlorobiales bacterium]|nr:tetratricopeptide repeat protein [Chlorobiales bacterium]